MPQLRDAFLLDPDTVFLNHGSFGACPREVFEHYQRWQLEMERNPVEFLGRRSDARIGNDYATASRCLRLGRPVALEAPRSGLARDFGQLAVVCGGQAESHRQGWLRSLFAGHPQPLPPPTEEESNGTA